MAEVIKMRNSDTMTEVISSWLKKEGDEIVSGDVLASWGGQNNHELESYEDGTLLYMGVPEKATVAVDAVIAIVETKRKILNPRPPPTQTKSGYTICLTRRKEVAIKTDKQAECTLVFKHKGNCFEDA